MKSKELESLDQDVSHSTVDDKVTSPHKQDAPRKASGNDAHLRTTDKQVSKTEKAKSVVAMQREVGNARVAKALAQPEAATSDAHPKAEAEHGATKAVDVEAKERILHH